MSLATPWAKSPHPKPQSFYITNKKTQQMKHIMVQIRISLRYELGRFVSLQVGASPVEGKLCYYKLV